MGIFDFFTKNWKKEMSNLKEKVNRAKDRFKSVEDRTSLEFCKMILAKLQQCSNENQFHSIETEWNKYYNTHFVENDTEGIIYRPGQSSFRSNTTSDLLYAADILADNLDLNDFEGNKSNTVREENSSTWEKSQTDNS